MARRRSFFLRSETFRTLVSTFAAAAVIAIFALIGALAIEINLSGSWLAAATVILGVVAALHASRRVEASMLRAAEAGNATSRPSEFSVGYYSLPLESLTPLLGTLAVAVLVLPPTQANHYGGDESSISSANCVFVIS